MRNSSCGLKAEREYKNIILHSPKLFDTGFRLDIVTGKCVSLYSRFQDAGYNSYFIDENHKSQNQDHIENFLKKTPELNTEDTVILSFLGKTDAYGSTLKKIADRFNEIKNSYPKIQLLTFGYLATSAIDDLLTYSSIDGVLTYDGIISNKGVSNNSISEILNNTLKSYSSLKNIPEHYFNNKQNSVVSVDGSYGCRGRCSFCAYNMDISSGWTKLDLNLAAQDILFLYEKYGVKRFAFTDNDFGGTQEECRERASVLSHYLSPIRDDISISINVRSETLTQESIDLLSNAGVRVFLIGVESFHPKNIKIIYGKKLDLEHLYKMVKHADEKNIQVVSSYILWHAWQTLDDIKYEIDEIQKYGRYRIPQFVVNSIVRVMPKTSMELKLFRNNLLIREPFDRGFIFKEKEVDDLYQRVKGYYESHIKPILKTCNENNPEDIRKVANLKIQEFNWFLTQL